MSISLIGGFFQKRGNLTFLSFNIDKIHKKYIIKKIYSLSKKKMANTPNILSNNLDQAPKNTNTRYQARLDAINEEIEQAFNAMHISGDPEIENWLSEHQNDIPLHKLNTLKAGESIAFEIKREKVEEIRGGWNEAPSAPKGINETIFKNIKYKLSKNHQEPLKN